VNVVPVRGVADLPRAPGRGTGDRFHDRDTGDRFLDRELSTDIDETQHLRFELEIAVQCLLNVVSVVLLLQLDTPPAHAAAFVDRVC
jgi:hypothetical protein